MFIYKHKNPLYAFVVRERQTLISFQALFCFQNITFLTALKNSADHTHTTNEYEATALFSNDAVTDEPQSYNWYPCHLQDCLRKKINEQHVRLSILHSLVGQLLLVLHALLLFWKQENRKYFRNKDDLFRASATSPATDFRSPKRWSALIWSKFDFSNGETPRISTEPHFAGSDI